MGVYIKGMKMPVSCFFCRFRNKVNPDEIMCLVTREIFEETFTATIKMRNGAGKCPLIEIPESHGDLIDRDALLDMVRDVNTDYYCEVLGVTVEDIDSVPTVIEAEGSEDECFR